MSLACWHAQDFQCLLFKLAAHRLAAGQPGTSFYSVKRFIGQQYGKATAAEARQVRGCDAMTQLQTLHGS